jgi:hypothetical protein
MRDWAKEIEAAIAPLNLSGGREADIVEELSQHLNDRYDELLIAGTGEEQAYRKLPYVFRQRLFPLVGRQAASSFRGSGRIWSMAPACLSKIPDLPWLQFCRWR